MRAFKPNIALLVREKDKGTPLFRQERLIRLKRQIDSFLPTVESLAYERCLNIFSPLPIDCIDAITQFFEDTSIVELEIITVDDHFWFISRKFLGQYTKITQMIRSFIF